MTACYCEVTGYSRLAPLQGSSVPSFYGHGSVDLSHTTPRRAIPPVVLVEYIDNAITLKDVDARLLTRPIITSLVDTVQRLGELLVCHSDPNYRNYLLAPADRPTRAGVIDFADCFWTAPDETEEEWSEQVLSEGEVREMKRKIRDRLEEAGECRREVYN